MPKCRFWLLDVNYEVKNEEAEIWLWGITESGQRALVVVKHFLAYFYAIVEENAASTHVVEEIESSQRPAIVKLEVVERKLFGRTVKAVKVYCRNPNGISECAGTLRDIEGIKECFEGDIRYSMRFLIDNNVVPCSWHEVEVAEETDNRDIQADIVYEARSLPKLLEKSEMPQLRILGFSTVCYSREGSPKPHRNPVVMISVSTNHGEERQFLANEDNDDKPVLEAFVNYVRGFDPDLIVGYGVNGQDWLYLKERCRQLGTHFYVDRTKTEPHTSTYGHVSVTGRANIDLLDYAEEFAEVKVKTLENLADYLGVMKTKNRKLIGDTELADHWDDRAKSEVLKQFSRDNTRCIMGIADAVLDFAMQLSSLVGLPLDHVGTATAGFRVEWFLTRQTHKISELVPKRVEQTYRPYAGAIVLSPQRGLHENVASLDFKSMYPNLMIAYNLSPDTYVPPDEPMPPGGVYETPEVKHRFRKEPVGFYKEALSHLIRARDEIRFNMKTLDSKSVEYRVLDARQKAVKVITNASYGYAGWTGARWYMKPVAEAATAWGRYTILNAVKMAEMVGLEVVYGDTDSIFVKNDPAKVQKLLGEIKEKLKLEISLDKIYVRILFTEAKKRYAGLLSDGHLDIVGLEVMRGDWAAVAREVQEKVLEIVLKEQSHEKAVKFVQQFIYDLRRRKVAFRDLIIWKTLTKSPEEYEVKAAHVEAARMLNEKGWELAVGDKVGYVVVIGTGRLHERVKPYAFATYDEIDIEYYVSKQVVPAAIRILENFGVSEHQIQAEQSGTKESRRLTDFLGD